MNSRLMFSAWHHVAKKGLSGIQKTMKKEECPLFHLFQLVTVDFSFILTKVNQVEKLGL